MKIKLIQELQPYSFKFICSLLEQDEATTENILKSLNIMNITRKLSSDLGELELEGLLEVDELGEITDSINRNMYVFKYVGMLMIGECCLFAYPKYVRNIFEDVNNGYDKFKRILKVIRKYQSKEQSQNLYGNEDISRFNLISFTMDLIQDYYDNGLYSNDKTVIEENGFGEILWEKTINENNMYFVNETPFYLDLYTANEIINEEDLFRRLHRCIISMCCQETAEILDILGIEKVIISNEKIHDFGNDEYLIYKITQELSQQFITSKQNILTKMIEYIHRDDDKNSSEKISFVGTNSFNLVWEDVCATVMDDCLNKTLFEMNLQPLDGRYSSDMLKDVMPKPKWIHNKSGIVHEAKKTLIPDLITVHEGVLSIYDAKYYKIKLDESSVNHQPGVGDVTKQYLYELAYKELAIKNNLKIDKNAFLMPTDDDIETSIGTVTIDLFSDYKEDIAFNDIEVILKPSEPMYEMYLIK